MSLGFSAGFVSFASHNEQWIRVFSIMTKIRCDTIMYNDNDELTMTRENIDLTVNYAHQTISGASDREGRTAPPKKWMERIRQRDNAHES